MRLTKQEINDARKTIEAILVSDEKVEQFYLSVGTRNFKAFIFGCLCGAAATGGVALAVIGMIL